MTINEKFIPLIEFQRIEPKNIKEIMIIIIRLTKMLTQEVVNFILSYTLFKEGASQPFLIYVKVDFNFKFDMLLDYI